MDGFSGLDPSFLASQTDPQCTHEVEQGQRQEREHLRVVNLSDATSPYVSIEPLQPQLGVLEKNDEFEGVPRPVS